MKTNITEQEAARLFNLFEDLTPEQDNLLHEKFSRYVFYDTLSNGSRNCECTYCRREFNVPRIARTMDKNYFEFMEARHNEPVKCPACGTKAILKNNGISKSKKSLLEWGFWVAFRLTEEGLFARAFSAEKDYRKTNRPMMMLHERARYWFGSGGRAAMWKYWGAWYKPYDWKIQKKIGTPFVGGWYSSYSGEYGILGAEDLKQSHFKYCGYEQWSNKKISDGSSHGELLTYLAEYTARPQMEMLIKLGKGDWIDDLIFQKCANGDITNWRAKTPEKMFRLDKQELREFFQSQIDPCELRIYKLLRNFGHKVNFKQAKEAMHFFEPYEMKWYVEEFTKHGVSIQRGINYLRKQGESYSEIKHSVCTWFKDYIEAAQKLEYDLSREDVFMPKQLAEAHDTAIAAVKHQADELKNRAYKKRYPKLLETYAYQDERFAVVIPRSMEEIIVEGKALSHCVGGYAARHVEGKTTILFLRNKKSIEKPLYTIEMNGSKLVQVQGKQNRTQLTPAAKKFFDAWQAWVKDGSKRKKKAQTISQKKSA